MCQDDWILGRIFSTCQNQGSDMEVMVTYRIFLEELHTDPL